LEYNFCVIPVCCIYINFFEASRTMNEETAKAFVAQLPTFDPSDSEKYKATCHCGLIRFTVTLSPPLPRHPIGACNCSICLKNGYLLVYSLRDRVVFSTGEDNLKTHTFGNKRNLHKFCGTCGSSVLFDPRLAELGDAPDLLGINVSTEMCM
jgi:hypothetical protein